LRRSGEIDGDLLGDRKGLAFRRVQGEGEFLDLRFGIWPCRRQGRGIVLGSQLNQRYPERDASWIRGGRIRYVETAQEDVISTSVELSAANQARESVREHFRRYAERLFFTKHVDWRDENEYRWVYYDADQSQTGRNGLKVPFVDIKTSVSAIVLGADYADAPTADRADVRASS
jgi:hypothetical protein